MKEKNLSKMISAHHDPELYDIISRFLKQDVHEADQLSVTERHLCVLSALMGCQGKEAFMAEMHEALEDGVDPIAIREAVYQAAAYLGLGRILPFLHTADALMQEQGSRCRCHRRARRMPMTALRKGWISKCSCLEKACASSKAKRRSRAATSTAGWQPIASVITTRAMA